MDEHYAQYLITKKIEAQKSLKDIRSKGETVAEEALEGALSTGYMYEKWDKTTRTDMSGVRKSSPHYKMLYQLKKMSDDPRRLDIVETNRKAIAKRMLTKELKASLEPKGLEVVLDPENNVYQVKEKKNNENKIQEKKLIPFTNEESNRLRAAIPNLAEYAKKLPTLSNLDDIHSIFANDIKNLIAAGGPYATLPKTS